MAASGSLIELKSRPARVAARQLHAAVKLISACAQKADGAQLGELLILICEAGIDRTEAAVASGDVGDQQVAAIARTAENVGAAAVRTEERNLLNAALTMDPGQFTTVAKNFEHRVDAAGALAEANRAYQRRFLHVGDPQDGVVRIDGLLDAEGGATVRAALAAQMKPIKDDDRTHGQRFADALVEFCRKG